MQPEHWVIAGLALLALFLAVRSRGGCNGHDWEKQGIDAGSLVSRGNLFVYQKQTGLGLGPCPYVIKGTVKYRCAHDGCSKTKTQWEQLTTVSNSDAPHWMREASLPQPLP